MFTKMEKSPSTNELLRKADMHLLQLQQEIEQVQAAITQAQARLEQIDRAAVQRAEELEVAHSHVQACTQSVERTQSYAELAAGTRQEREASTQLKQAQAALTQAQARYDEDTQRAVREQKKDDEQADVLRQLLSKRQQELQDLYTKQHTVSAAKEQAFLSRGREIHQSALAAIRQQQGRLDAIAHGVEQERLALAQLVEKTLDELADYPELAGEIRAMHPRDDATSRALTAALAYIDTLLNERGQVPDHVTLASTRFVSPFLSLFEIPAEEVWKGVNIRENPTGLLNRRDQIAQVLAEYRESQRDA